LQADSGFAAYPLVDPVIVADTDGDGYIPANAPVQANEAAIGYPTTNLSNPPVPAGVFFHAAVRDTSPSIDPARPAVQVQRTCRLEHELTDAWFSALARGTSAGVISSLGGAAARDVPVWLLPPGQVDDLFWNELGRPRHARSAGFVARPPAFS
jgi:hypothetical protein